MERRWQSLTGLFAGLFFVVGHAMPQAYTISAKSGAVNYIEGTAYLNGNRLAEKANRATFLLANDTLSTEAGKAEVLLSPGVFLRIGDNSQIRMISPSLVNSQVEVTRGEAMIEVAGLVKDNTVQVVDHGGSITIQRDGLYRIIAEGSPKVDIIEGKALVAFGSREIDLNKGHEALLNDQLKTDKFDPKEPDDLYAWSNIRSQYDAAASYQTASNVGANSFGAWGGYGFGGFAAPGWYWANGFDSWAWLPGAGAFYSPFGYGFYSPGAVAYAPVVWAPVSGGGGYGPGPVRKANVPLNPNHPAAVGAITSSPAANSVARAAAVQSFAYSGFRTATGAPVAAFSGSHATAVSSSGNVGVASSGGHVASAMSSGGGGGISAGAAHSGGSFSTGGGGAGSGHR